MLSHENEVKRIFKACKASKGNAQLLQESLLYTKAEEVKENSLVQVCTLYAISRMAASAIHEYRNSSRNVATRKSR